MDPSQTHASDRPAPPQAAGPDAAAGAPAGPPEAAPPAIVVLEDVKKEYVTREHRVLALNGVSMRMPPGGFTAIMGASGSGKSTLLHVVGGLTPPSAGRILIEGHDLARMSDRQRTLFRRRRLGIIFQDYNLLPTLTARENVALPALVDGTAAADFDGRARELLAAVHLEHRIGHRPDALSGGEQQRVAIARALFNDPAIILADEPTGNLDSRQSMEIWKLLRRISSERGVTILMVTHEAQAAAFADEVVILKDGVIVGRLEPRGSADAAPVAAGYQELAG